MGSFDTETFAPRAVGGRYVLFEEFARGGMASIHLARLVGAEGFSRVVAVKRVRSAFLDSEPHRRALLAEARITSRIRHPNVVQTLDIVIEEGSAYVIMEYVHGVTVGELLQEASVRGERAPVGVAVGIIADALQGLHAAHEARDARGAQLGVVHRDVSPQNVQVGTDGLARLLDFGIAWAMDRTQLTEPGVVKGKLAYMPREQLGGSPVTRQADVYAMGVVLWELLTGKRLYDDPDPARIAARVLTETAPAPSLHASDVAPALDQVVLRATAPDPRGRFETAGEMAAALAFAVPRAEAQEISSWVERLAGDQLELRAEAVQRVESAPVDAILAAPAGEAPSAPRPARRLPVVLASALLALVAGGVVVGALLRANTASPAASSPGAALSPSSSAPPPSAPAVAEPVATVPVETASPPAGGPASGRAHGGRRRPASSACDPPFSIEPSGRKHYKPECLR